MRIDYVNGHNEFDGSLWFFDGEYVGHDDQIGVHDFAEKGEWRVIEFHHRAIRDDFNVEEETDDLFLAETLEEAEPYLKQGD